MSKLCKLEKMKKKPKFAVRSHNRCPLCGRPRGYHRKFKMCRICLRNRALKGEVPGVVKSSSVSHGPTIRSTIEWLSGRSFMGLTDPIADMVTRIRNAARAGHEKVDVPCSTMKVRLAEILRDEGFVQGFDVIERAPRSVLRVYLRYDADKKCVIGGVKRESRPGLRLYLGHDEIPRVMGGLGVGILSTSRGLMTDRKARAEHIGGELLCTVW